MTRLELNIIVVGGSGDEKARAQYKYRRWRW